VGYRDEKKERMNKYIYIYIYIYILSRTEGQRDFQKHGFIYLE
jgi:hypothetical protein